jgi:molybdopterin/thiamine biosynthesis adenylyltransferase
MASTTAPIEPNPLRIRTANILLVGIRAVANEVAKNLVLAGIGSITLADHDVVEEEDLGAQFCISEADVGKNVGDKPSASLLRADFL